MYYTPKIEDLFDGYEFELQVYDEEKNGYIDEWEKLTFSVRDGLEHDSFCTFTEGRVRVEMFKLPLLLKLGWEQHESFSYKKDGIYIEFMGDNKYWIGDFMSRKFNSDGDLFYGKINTINDFKKVMSYITE